VICGVTGSGKSVLAAEVSRRLGIPYVASDEIYWLPGWQKRPEEERAARYAQIATSEAWVVDSLPSAGRRALLSRADLVIALDLPRAVSLARLVRRTVRRFVTREQICNGNTETVRSLIGRESIVLWHFRSFAATRHAVAELVADPGAPPVVVLTTPHEVAAWLAGLTA
jgi:adenylate kinase family enzyme